jgi:hypothetical protein
LAHRRLIALVVLLCQVATAAPVHTIQAQTPATPASGQAHCAEHAQANATVASEQAPAPPTDHVRHSDSCGRGCCQCPCAQAPALAGALAAVSSTTHRPVTVSYRLLDVARIASAFFRPPI